MVQSIRCGVLALVLVVSVSVTEGSKYGDVSKRVDEVTTRLHVGLADREECSRDADCDDWCKEANADRCLCRCPDWLQGGSFHCPNKKFCQAVPHNFWGGAFNVTSANFHKMCKKHETMMVVFTANSCLHCVDFEPAYRWATPLLQEKGVPLARMDVDMNKDFAHGDLGLQSLPAIKIFQKCKDVAMYKSQHVVENIVEYGQKITSRPYAILKTEDDVKDFAAKHPFSVVAFMEYPNAGEEEEVEDFAEAAKEMKYSHNTFFGFVSGKKLVEKFRGASKMYTQSPTVVIFRNLEGDDQEKESVVLTELEAKLQEWVKAKSVRIVDEITNTNFVYYENLKLPMLLLFLDPKINNRPLLREVKNVARMYLGRVSFGWLNADQHGSRMVALGLDHTKLPAMGFNTMQGGRFPFPASQTINEENIRKFVEEFLSGRMNPLPQHAPSEQTGAVAAAEAEEKMPGCTDLTYKTFGSEVLDDTKHDVVTMFMSSNSQTYKDFHIYWRKTVERFRLLGIESVKLTRYDVAKNEIPKGVELETTPTIVLFTAKDKSPPFKVYHGKAKVRPMMFWVQEMASIKFEFENDTPHLDAEQREAYLVQIKERDEKVGAERAKKKEERIAKLSEDAKREEL